MEEAEARFKLFWAAAMKLAPEQLRELADDLEAKAEDLRIIAQDVEARNDKPDGE